MDVAAFLAAEFPIDGPHTAYRARHATALAAGLFRYLNHATGYDHGALADPQDTAVVLADLAEALKLAPQLVRQAANGVRMRRYQVDARGCDVDAVVDELVVYASDATPHLQEAARLLAQAGHAAGRLTLT